MPAPWCRRYLPARRQCAAPPLRTCRSAIAGRAPFRGRGHRRSRARRLFTGPGRERRHRGCGPPAFRWRALSAARLGNHAQSHPHDDRTDCGMATVRDCACVEILHGARHQPAARCAGCSLGTGLFRPIYPGPKPTISMPNSISRTIRRKPDLSDALKNGRSRRLQHMWSDAGGTPAVRHAVSPAGKSRTSRKVAIDHNRSPRMTHPVGPRPSRPRGFGTARVAAGSQTRHVLCDAGRDARGRHAVSSARKSRTSRNVAIDQDRSPRMTHPVGPRPSRPRGFGTARVAAGITNASCPV